MTEKNQLHNFSAEEVALIRKTVGKDAANEEEFQRFLYRASKLGLNPLDGTIHLLSRRRKGTDGVYRPTNVIIVGIDGFRAVGDGTGKMSGIKRGVNYDDKARLIGAWAEVYRKDWDCPAREEVSAREYLPAGEGGLGSKMPETMLKKCAEAAAHRMAWSAQLAGIYVAEEFLNEDPENKPDPKNGGKPEPAKTDPAKNKPAEKPAGKPGAAKAESGKPESKPGTQPEKPENKPEAAKDEKPKDKPAGKPESAKTADKPAGKPESAKGDVYESTITITSEPKEIPGSETNPSTKVGIVGTDISNNEISLIGMEPEIKEAMKKLEPGNFVKVTGDKRENGKVFVLVKTITVIGTEVAGENPAEKPAEAPAGKPAEAPAGEKPAEPAAEKPAEKPADADGKVTLELVVSKNASEYNRVVDGKETPMKWFKGADKETDYIVMCEKSSGCADVLGEVIVGDKVQVAGKPFEEKGKKAIIVDSMAFLETAPRTA
ncbi:recombinase RecT [Pelotomaculum propionicicum]|uniref:recombinase RecT n=1 Tax=Pelotomaculum propionicicum TaxID=258475 RepID=UPI003B7FC6EA